MGQLIAALLHLQSVERQLTQAHRRLKNRNKAVSTQKQRIKELQEQWQLQHDRVITRRKEGDSLELDLQTHEEQVAKLRQSLNTARTNKEYAAVLTQINTIKADNAKLEEQALKVLQEVDTIRAEADSTNGKIELEKQHLAKLEQENQEEIVRLQGIIDNLTSDRAKAAAEVPSKELAIFDRIAANYDGEAMAAIEIHGKKPPHEYICGGCCMSLNAEHANALRVRDQIRMCNNCGRILYLEPQVENSNT